MKSKERVLSAVNHQEPDRVPSDYWGTPEVTNELTRYLKVRNSEELLTKLRVDIRYVKPAYGKGEFKEQPDGSLQRTRKDGKYVDIWGVVRRKILWSKGSYLELEESPLGKAETAKEIEDYSFPNPNEFDYLSVKTASRAHKDYGVICTGDRLTTRSSVFKLAMYLRGMDKLLMDLSLNPHLAETLVNKLLQFHLEHNQRIFEAAGKEIDIFMIGDDFGTQNGPLISLSMFRRFFKPALQELFQLAKKFDLKLMLHSCGGIRTLIPDLIGLGLDILNPIQPEARGMEPEELEREFGRDLCFHGSLDVQKSLPSASREEVRAAVKTSCQVLGRNGGLILAPTHNFQRDIPLRNILALYEAVAEYGRY